MSPTTGQPDPAPRDNPAIRVVIAGVWCYRVTLGRLMGGHCRYQPTCSQYMIDAVRKHGAIRGTAKGLCRIARCHPFRDGGYDPA